MGMSERLLENRILAFQPRGRVKFRAGGQEGEKEATWSVTACAQFLGLKVGPVRTIFYVQGSASGRTTTRTDSLFPAHQRSRTKLRVHLGVPAIMHYTDYLSSVSPSELFVRSGSP